MDNRNAGKLPRRPVMGSPVLTPMETMMYMPSCPACGEVPYDLPECGCCGQPFLYDEEPVEVEEVE